MMGIRVAVTGCAGFIGSHLVDELLRRGQEVVGIDNFSSGCMSNLAGALEDEDFTLIEGDILSEEDLEALMKGVETVYHLAANPDVRIGADDTQTHLDQNVMGTYSVLEMMRRQRVGSLSFTSTSTVYGEAEIIPTPENYGPLMPISLYGASKLASEALICSYCHTFDMRALIFRFANVVGLRSGHGVIPDFLSKLERDPSTLEILGRRPGTHKSYCHISDCVSAMLAAERSCTDRVGIYNIGSPDVLDVERIADMVCEEMGLRKVRYSWTGGVDDGRGWLGDVRRMQLSIDKLVSEGWSPRYGSEESVRLAIRELLGERQG